MKPEKPFLHADDVNYPEPSRWELIRDVLVFQVKLFVDGIRDFLLVPVSLIAAFIDIVTTRNRTGKNFYKVVLMGKRSEQWINLFGAADRVINAASDDYRPKQPRLDDLVYKMEEMVVQQYESGKVTASAKNAIDRFLDTVQKKGESKKP